MPMCPGRYFNVSEPKRLTKEEWEKWKVAIMSQCIVPDKDGNFYMCTVCRSIGCEHVTSKMYRRRNFCAYEVN